MHRYGPQISPTSTDGIRTDLFKTNAGVIRDLITGVSKFCSKAFVLIITNPVNSTLPIAVEVLKQHGVFNARKIFGVTTLDVVRASTFLAQALEEADPKKFKIPVVGGHSGSTILPLYGQCTPPVTLSNQQLNDLTYRKSSGNLSPIRPWLLIGIQGCNLVVTRLCRPRPALDLQQPAWRMLRSASSAQF